METFDESNSKGDARKMVDIYFLVEYFIQQHKHGHFVLDECPFLKPICKLLML